MAEMIYDCCIQNAENLSARLVLLRTLAALKKIDAPLPEAQQNKDAQTALLCGHGPEET